MMKDTIKCTFLGDVMCKSELIEAFRSETGFDFQDMFSKVSPFLKQSDLVFANLETPISLDNSDLTTEKYCFNSPYEFAKAAKEAGIDIVATANNHCMDRGIKGIKSTIDSLNKIGFIHTGIFDEKQREHVIVEKNGIRFGLLSYTYGTNAFSNHQYLEKKDRWKVNLFQNQELSNPIDRFFYYHRNSIIAKVYNRIVEKLCPGQISKPIYEHREFDFYCKKQIKHDIASLKKKGADIVIMYMHAGGQYNDEATNYTKQLSKWLSNAGVDWIIGSHEHVVHGGVFSDISNGKMTAYSLGNFDGITGVYANPMDKMSEYSVALNVYVDKNLVINKATFTILKSIEIENRKIQVVPVDLLIEEMKDESLINELWNDMKKIAYKFCGMDIEKTGIQREYQIG